MEHGRWRRMKRLRRSSGGHYDGCCAVEQVDVRIAIGRTARIACHKQRTNKSQNPARDRGVRWRI